MKINPALYVYCGLMLLTLGLYWPGLHGPFFLDDLQSLDPAKIDHFSFRSFLEICLNNDTGPLGRPISIASFALNYLFFGNDAFSFKAVNLGIHLFIGFMVSFYIYLIMLLQPKIKQHAIWFALLTGLIWVIHPLQVSTVLYVVQRMTQLCHLFILMGLITYLLGRIRLITNKPHSYTLMLTSLFFFFPLSLFSKETGVLFILYLLCSEYFILRFKARKPDQQKLIFCHCFLSIGFVLIALVYYLYKLPLFLTLFSEKNITLLERLMTETKVIIFYIKLIYLPMLSQMSLYHDDFPISHTLDIEVALSSFGIACCIFLIFSLRKRAPIVSFGLAWFLISQLIESTILPLELVFEHRNYLASIGLIFILSYYYVLLLMRSSFSFKVIYAVLLLMLIILLMILTLIRSVTWSTPYKFLTQEVYHHPQSTRAHIEMANWFLTKGDYIQAFKELDKAQELQPHNAGVDLHKILIFCRSKTVAPSLYESASSKIRQGAITPYVILVIEKIIKNMFDTHCDSVDKSKINQMIQEAKHNRFINHKPRYLAVLYHLESGLALLENNVNKCRILLNKSFESYPDRLDPLIQKAYLEIQYGMIKEAKDTVKQVDRNARFLRSPSGEIMILHRTLSRVETKVNSK